MTAPVNGPAFGGGMKIAGMWNYGLVNAVLVMPCQLGDGMREGPLA